MMQSPKSNRVTKSPSTPAILLFVTIMDTTWRMFVPIISGTIVGIILDHALNAKPLFTILMVIISTAISLFLVKQQIKKGQNL